MARFAYWRVEISRKIDRSISISIIRKWSGNALCSSICTCTYNISGNVNLNWRYLPQGLCKAHVRPMLRGYGPRIWPQMAQYFRLGTWMHHWKTVFTSQKKCIHHLQPKKKRVQNLNQQRKTEKNLYRFHQQKLRFPPKRSQKTKGPEGKSEGKWKGRMVTGHQGLPPRRLRCPGAVAASQWGTLGAASQDGPDEH